MPPALKILIVDDDPTVLESASANLEAEGHSVLVAANGGDAMRLLEKGQVRGKVVITL